MTPTLWTRRRYATVKRVVRERVLREHRQRIAVRRRLAAQHLYGSGLEIGALHIPLRVPRRAHVRHLDRMTVPELRAHYPELELCELVAPDIIDDGETLATVPDDSLDFVIANHVLEHCEDPIGTLTSHLRVLRPGGTLYVAVPDGRLTFDRDRAVTALDHLVRDHREGPARSRRAHYEEWARLVNRVPEAEVAARADELSAQAYSIHFHVWTPVAFLELIVHCRAELGLPLEFEALERNGHEFIVILTRAASALPAAAPPLAGQLERVAGG